MIVEKGIKEELRWFYEARFGMFIHFGVYSLLGHGEWAMLLENIPREEYIKLAKDFNPYRFNTDEWVKLAADAGARYITVTAKHHDGFCLFDSALTDFKITNTPFKRDLIGELIDACHRHYMRIIIYYSQPDWNHPNYVHNREAFKDLDNPPATDRPDWPEYQKYYIGQVEELCTKYGRIDGIWFDGSHKTIEEWKGREVYELIKKYQPHAVVNDRARYGDFFTPECLLPEYLTGYLFKACETINPVAFGYMNDASSYSVPFLVKSLVKMAASGGNYLLNVGPAPDGTIPDKQAQIMKEMGKWMKVNGKAVYKTDPVFFDMHKEMYRGTKVDKSIYLYCINWPDINSITVPGINTEVKKVSLLSSGINIKFKQDENRVELYDLPSIPPDSLVQVFELGFDEIPEIQEKIVPKTEAPVININGRGSTGLYAESAQLTGYGVKGQKLYISEVPGSKTRFIDGWFVPEQEALWNISCPEEGSYKVYVSAACPEGRGGSVIRVTAAGSELFIGMPETYRKEVDEYKIAGISPDTKFKAIEAGTVNLPAGTSAISVSPEKLKWGYVFGMIEKVVLERV